MKVMPCCLTISAPYCYFFEFEITYFRGQDQSAGSGPVKGETVAKLKVAINGFGRIGRNFLRCWHGRKDSPLEVVVVNDSGGVKNVSL